MPRFVLNQLGGLLTEFLLAMALTAGLIGTTGNYLAKTVRKQYQLQKQIQLSNELQQLFVQMEKAVRRSGYCAGVSCRGYALQIISGSCLSLNWDNRKIASLGSAIHTYNQGIAFRWSHQQIESRSGVNTSCGGYGWEQVTDPTLGKIKQFRIKSTRQALVIYLEVQSSGLSLHRYYRVRRMNNR